MKFLSNVNMESNIITALLDPTSDQYAATKKYVDDNAGGSTATVNYIDRYTLPGDQTTATIDITQYDTTEDLLIVYLNSVYIKKDTEYTITNATTITVPTGTWYSGDIFDFLVLKKVSATSVAGDEVTYENLNTNGDVGTGATQVAQGNHEHSGYEPADSTIVKDADFASDGILKRTSAGGYGVVTDSSTNWDSAYTHIAEDGSSHADVVTNTNHITSDGKNHSDVVTNNAKVSNVTHTSEVTGSTDLTITDNVVDEANLKLDEGPTNDYVLTADSAKTGGMKWAEASSGGITTGKAIAMAMIFG